MTFYGWSNAFLHYPPTNEGVAPYLEYKFGDTLSPCHTQNIIIINIIMSSLLEPVTIGGKLSLRNRVVMGSMTRNRCVDDYKPGPAQITHYADRARDGTGLIVNEGTFVDWTGCDWKYSPFMVTEEHAAAWKAVTDAVHNEGGKIFFQAWHAGIYSRYMIMIFTADIQ